VKRVVTVLLSAVVASGCAAAPGGESASHAWPGCDHYSSQHQAQRAWRRDGRPSSADGNGDGRVCTSLPAAALPSRTTGCEHTARVVPVGLSKTKYPHILGHAARAAAEGYGRVWTLNRPGAAERRDRLLANIPTRPGYDRDEAPMAAARRSWHADVEYVPSSENRSAGSVVGIKLRRFCDGTRFEYVGY
jgi:hypothetical protein